MAGEAERAGLGLAVVVRTCVRRRGGEGRGGEEEVWGLARRGRSSLCVQRSSLRTWMLRTTAHSTPPQPPPPTYANAPTPRATPARRKRRCRWDIPFWAERLRESKYSISDEELRPYFALPNVLDGLFKVGGGGGGGGLSVRTGAAGGVGGAGGARARRAGAGRAAVYVCNQSRPTCHCLLGAVPRLWPLLPCGMRDAPPGSRPTPPTRTGPHTCICPPACRCVRPTDRPPNRPPPPHTHTRTLRAAGGAAVWRGGGASGRPGADVAPRREVLQGEEVSCL